MDAKDIYIKLLKYQIKRNKVDHLCIDLDEMAQSYSDLLDKYKIENKFGSDLDAFNKKEFISFANITICYVCDKRNPNVQCIQCGGYVHSTCIPGQRNNNQFSCDRCC